MALFARPLSWLSPAVAFGGALPAVWILARGLSHGLGANPIAEALNELGLLALALLVLSLACTPLRTLTGSAWPIRVRRALGLLAFFYALGHFLCYAVLDQGLALGAIAADVVERPFIFVGFAALVILTPLAVTSTATWTKRLGAARWKRLHRLAYLAGALGVVHFVLRVKKDVSEPAVYGALLGLLFAVRLVAFARDRAAKARAAA
ncbi:MAG TPA: protein-methionine-sulfoxide reductase heme-binding subunit MsrQ [Minicystis sp.]|nr:protein-methionine-sulfoxide reductase heme-binding subunit MsrQ [Minicystis sp.]